MRLGIVGGGAMGEAIVAAVLRRKIVSPADVTVAERIAERAAVLEKTYGVRTTPDVAAAAESDLFIVAVKPQDFGTLAAIAGRIGPDTTAVSIMAGVPLAQLTGVLRHDAVVRAMPNTPAQIGEGMTLWTATAAVGDAAKAGATRVFEALGRQVYVADEKYLDMATGVSGSGPGFVLLFIEAMIDAAVHIGFTRDLATEMVLQTVVGTARLAQESGRHPAELRAQVTSPGGTTAEGLKALEAGKLRSAVLDAVEAAYNKSKAMGGGTGQK